MNLCIPTSDENGLDSRIHGHFGSAPYLALVDARNLAVEFLPKEGAPPHADGHHGGGCQPAAALGGRTVDAVFCHGMGRGALTSLEALGIPVYQTGAATVREALEAILRGEVQRMETATCAGHGHGHGGGCCGGN